MLGRRSFAKRRAGFGPALGPASALRRPAPPPSPPRRACDRAVPRSSRSRKTARANRRKANATRCGRRPNPSPLAAPGPPAAWPARRHVAASSNFSRSFLKFHLEIGESEPARRAAAPAGGILCAPPAPRDPVRVAVAGPRARRPAAARRTDSDLPIHRRVRSGAVGRALPFLRGVVGWRPPCGETRPGRGARPGCVRGWVGAARGQLGVLGGGGCPLACCQSRGRPGPVNGCSRHG